AVAEHPDAIALHDGDTAFTYAELDRRAGRWANRLSVLGVGAEDVIAVALDRSAESVVATWAVTRTGAAVLPL
ncbi:amino acid adenylation domain-containing protein, partial [Streptomyces sp. SID10244]|nr:amino acid adenylation domain-containing protein [Streptomyces sp. SID10244]